MRDIIFIVVIIFNLGLSAGIYFNHIRHNTKALGDLKKDISNIFSIVNSNRDRISRIEGRLNNRK